jgi:hypothetical protein
MPATTSPNSGAGLPGGSLRVCSEPWGKTTTSPALSATDSPVESTVAKHDPATTT